MATYSIILVWKIPWTEESGGPQSMGSQRVLSIFFLAIKKGSTVKICFSNKYLMLPLWEITVLYSFFFPNPPQHLPLAHDL